MNTNIGHIVGGKIIKSEGALQQENDWRLAQMHHKK
jgi:hypothetical protein